MLKKNRPRAYQNANFKANGKYEVGFVSDNQTSLAITASENRRMKP